MSQLGNIPPSPLPGYGEPLRRSISISDPLGLAFKRMKRVLFQPFDIGKWFTLGFCAFLANLMGQAGSGCNFGGQFPLPGPLRPTPPVVTMPATMPGTFPPPTTAPAPTPLRDATDWLIAHWITLIPFAAGGLIVFLGIMAVLQWLNSRGSFMFLDGVVRNRGAVKEPWHRYRPHANGYFRTVFLLLLIGVGLMFLIWGLGLYLAWPDLRNERFTGRGIAAIVTVMGLTICGTLPLAIASLVLQDFVLPVMYLTGKSPGEAWRTVRARIVSGHVGKLILFYLMRWALFVAYGFVSIIATCATCCLAGLPYLGSVILLPIFVFDRSYVLYFIQQFGDDLRFFRPVTWPPLCDACGYDLRASTTDRCTECGRSIPPEQWAYIQQAQRLGAPPAQPL